MEKFIFEAQELRKVDLFYGMSYKDLLMLIFPPNNYAALVRWMDTSAGKNAIPGYESMSYGERAASLRKIVPWYVESQQLKIATYNYNRKKAKNAYIL